MTADEAYAQLTPKNQQRVDSKEHLMRFWMERLGDDEETKAQFVEMLGAALSEEFNNGIDEAQALIAALAAGGAPAHKHALTVASTALVKLAARNRGKAEPKLAA